VLQRDPDITNTAFDDDELSNELRVDSMKKNRDDDRSKRQPGGVSGGGGGDRNPNPNMS